MISLFEMYLALPALLVIIIPAFIVAEIVCLSAQNGVLATLAFAILSICVVLSGWSHVHEFVSQNALTLVICVVCYIVIGLIWSMAKYWHECYIAAQKYNKRKAELLKQYNVPTVEALDETSAVSFTFSLNSSMEEFSCMRLGRGIHFPYEYTSLMDSILMWTFYWPFSIINSMLGDVLITFVRSLVKYFGAVYSNIEQSVFAGVNTDATTLKNKSDAASKNRHTTSADGR